MLRPKKAILLTSMLVIILWGCTEKIVTGDLLIKNINIIDVETGEVRQSMNLIVTADTISCIQENDSKIEYSVPSSIDGTDKYLIPGLWDMHTHLALVDSAEIFLPKFLGSGVIGVREMHGNKYLDSLLSRIRKGRYNGFNIIKAGPIVDGDPPSSDFSQVIRTEQEGREFVRKQKSDGANFVKTYFNLDRKVYLAIADECKKLDLPIAGHLPNRVSLGEAVEAGHQTFDHFWNIIAAFSEQEGLAEIERSREGSFTGSNFYVRRDYIEKTYNPQKQDSIILILTSKLTYICPTFTTLKGFYRNLDPNYVDSRIDEMPSQELRDWWTYNEGKEVSEETVRQRESDKWYFGEVIRHIKAFSDAGIKFLAGTDFPNFFSFPGLGVHEELDIFVNEAGLSEIEALRTATIYPAEYLELEEMYGKIEVGKKASLVILNANPLEEIKNTRSIKGLLLEGDYFNYQELSEMLEAKRRK